MRKPETWMISITDNPISQYYKEICLPTWQENGYKVNHFEAITPESMKNITDLDFFGKLRKNGKVVPFSETEKAVWYSHYFLWVNCIKLNKPIIVFEHDAFMTSDVKPSQFRGVDFAFMCNKLTPENYRGLLPCGAYYISPKMAKCFVELSRRKVSAQKYDNVGVYVNVDGFVRRTVEDLGKRKIINYVNFRMCAEQIIHNDVGTTIEHNK
jgi:GR25 family glycosyltransferase involved in LPS biosynthesis